MAVEKAAGHNRFFGNLAFIACPGPVFKAEFGGIDAQKPRRLVHYALNGKGDLRRAVGPHGTPGRNVAVNGPGRTAVHRPWIHIMTLGGPGRDDRVAVGGVRPGVGNCIKINALDRPFLVQPNLHFDRQKGGAPWCRSYIPHGPA